MAKFLDLLERSILVQSFVTLAVVCTDLYLWLTGQALPEGLLQITWLILGFYFGSKVTQTANQQNIKRKV